MDGLIAFVVVGAMIGIPLLIFVNKVKSDSKQSPISPYVTRAKLAWNNAPANIRILMLESLGVSDADRNILIVRPWNTLYGEVQTELVKLQFITEMEIAQNPSLSHLQEKL